MTWTIRVPNWREFQNYAERRPPWIKLHRMLLEKPAWRRLSGSAAKLLVDVWMLAAGSRNGEIAMTITDLAYSVRLPEADVLADLQALAGHQFVELGNGLQASASACLQEGTEWVPEQRRGETETEQRREETPKSKALVALRATTRLSVPVIVERLKDVEQTTARRENADSRRDVFVEIVFAYWAKKLGHERVMLDSKRRATLRRRLVENGDDVSELLYVVDGALRDDWTMGRDARSTKRFDGIETIYQDRAHVEKFAAMNGAWKRGEAHPMAEKYAEAPA